MAERMRLRLSGRSRAFRLVWTAIMPQPISTPTAAGMMAPFVGMTLPTVAPMPQWTSGMAAIHLKMKGSWATFKSCWRAWSSRGTSLVQALMGAPFSGTINGKEFPAFWFRRSGRPRAAMDCVLVSGLFPILAQLALSSETSDLKRRCETLPWSILRGCRTGGNRSKRGPNDDGHQSKASGCRCDLGVRRGGNAGAYRVRESIASGSGMGGAGESSGFSNCRQSEVGGIASAGAGGAGPLGRGAYLRGEPARSLFRAGLCGGAGPALPNGVVEAVGARAPGGSDW